MLILTPRGQRITITTPNGKVTIVHFEDGQIGIDAPREWAVTREKIDKT